MHDELKLALLKLLTQVQSVVDAYVGESMVDKHSGKYVEDRCRVSRRRMVKLCLEFGSVPMITGNMFRLG